MADEKIKPEPLSYSIERLEKDTGLSSSYWRREIRLGNLAARRCGSRIIVLRDEIEKYLTSMSPAR